MPRNKNRRWTDPQWVKRLQAIGIDRPIVISEWSDEKTLQEEQRLETERAAFLAEAQKPVGDFLEAQNHARLDELARRTEDFTRDFSAFEHFRTAFREKKIKKRREKLERLRALHGPTITWEGLAFLLATQLYAGFDVVDKPPPGNQPWTLEDRLNFVARVKKRIAAGAAEKVALFDVQKAFLEYEKYTVGSFKTLYHQCLNKLEDEAQRAEAKQQPPFKTLMDICMYGQWPLTLRHPHLHWMPPEDMEGSARDQMSPDRDKYLADLISFT